MDKKRISTRFVSPAQDFDLEVLVRRLRKGFAFSVGIAAALHLIVAGINPFKEAEQKAPRPMTAKFIKREPRLTKPLELRKIPQPKRQLARREVQLARARMDQVQATATFDTRQLIASHVGGSGIGLETHIGALSAVGGTNLEPKLAAVAVTSTRASEHKIDMALEMIGVNSMDTGRYKAVVIQDEGDKQAIKGFIKIAHVLSAGTIAGSGKHDGSLHGQLNLDKLDGLCDVIATFSGLKAEFVGTITYDDERLLEIPIILPQGEPNEAEMDNLARYLMGGGFVIGSYWPEALIKYGGLIEGHDFWTERLRPEHPVFSSFYNVGSSYSRTFGDPNITPDWRHVTGYFVKGRLVGITEIFWGLGENPRWNMMAVNTVVYALTQEGSITQRLMQMVD
jgi:hypothetical protein